MNLVRLKNVLLLGVAALVMMSVSVGTAMAHSVTIDDVIALSDFGEENPYLGIAHADEYDWKGYLTLTVSNTGDQGWGDFHFFLFDVAGVSSDTVKFIDAPDEPAIEKNGIPLLFDYTISPDLHQLDLVFYNDPILSGEQATFTIYTDNTSEPNASIFGVGFYATPVPVPGALIMLASGMIALLGLRRKNKG